MRAWTGRAVLAAALALATMLPAAAPAASPLKVGVTPNYPPLIYKQGDTITGLEAELAQKLGKELKRPVTFVPLAWEQLIQALLDKKVDIVMSGLSVTPAREIRVRFVEPYLKTGLVAAFRAEDAGRYKTKDAILNSLAVVAAAEGTTGDGFVKRNFAPGTKKVVLQRPSDAAEGLKRGHIDIFVHDAVYVLWMVSENEAVLSALWETFDREDLAWAVRKGEDDFAAEVDRAVKKWKADGTLNAALAKWLPAVYLKHFQ